MKVTLGIYKIKNLVTGKLYIGSAINLYHREHIHFSLLKYNKHFNIHLQNSYNKYGKDNFIFKVLEIVKDKINLIKLEQYWIDYYGFNNLYNILSFAGSNLGKKTSEETKKKLSIASQNRSEETRNRMSLAQKGRKHSEETKKKISLAHIGRKLSSITRKKMSLIAKNRKFSEETRKKMGLSRRRKVNQYDLDNNYIQTFNSLKEAGEIVGTHDRNISACCRGNCKTAGGFKWSYVKTKDKI